MQLLIQNIVLLLGLTEASWPHIITSIFLLAFIVLQSILSLVSKKESSLKGLLPPWLKFSNKLR